MESDDVVGDVCTAGGAINGSGHFEGVRHFEGERLYLLHDELAQSRAERSVFVKERGVCLGMEERHKDLVCVQERVFASADVEFDERVLLRDELFSGQGGVGMAS